MTATLIITSITCIALIASIVFKPSITIKGLSIGTYWMVTLIGAILLICFKLVSIDTIYLECIASKEEASPIKLLVLFISLSFISIYLDEAGFFKFAANFALKKAGNSQIKLFLSLYVVVSILTIFTSNDIVILTFTPFMCIFCKHAKINPIPYLIAEFVAANTWSMFLIIGNPTNICLATSLDINFLEYFKAMIIPTIFAGVTSFFILFLLFYKRLKDPMDKAMIEEETIKDPASTIFGVVCLFGCIIGMAISSYIKVQMYLVPLFFAILLIILSIIKMIIKKDGSRFLLHSAKRVTWELIPFIFSMYIIVLALKEQGITSKIAEILGTKFDGIVYGLSSSIFANILNNIPMSVLYSTILETANVSNRAIYASIIGSNIGAFITPVGALAGIMWMHILKKYDVDFEFLDFIKFGSIIGFPTVIVACLGLYIF